MNEIKVVAFDPSLTNWGVAVGRLNLETFEVEIDDLQTICTEKSKDRSIRLSYDDVARWREIYKGVSPLLQDAKLVFSEIPAGAKDANAAFALGGVKAMLGALNKPLIQVMPKETKLASVGSSTATKKEVINWAVKQYPDAPWQRVKKTGTVMMKNEHMADAVAVLHAGLQTAQFHQLLALMKVA